MEPLNTLPLYHCFINDTKTGSSDAFARPPLSQTERGSLKPESQRWGLKMAREGRVLRGLVARTGASQAHTVQGLMEKGFKNKLSSYIWVIYLYSFILMSRWGTLFIIFVRRGHYFKLGSLA